MTVLNGFRIVSILEGISFLVLLFVAYIINYREHLFYFGMVHGVFFTLYFFYSLVVSHKCKWSVIFWLLVLFCAVIPFAFIPLEIKLGKLSRQLNDVKSSL